MIVGILLAAGTGTRFGGDKLLFPLADGTPVGVQAARNLLSGVDHGVAVLRPSDRQLAHLLEAEGMQVAFCPGAETGMGTSLAFGVTAAQDEDGWLIALADMPFIQHDTIRRRSQPASSRRADRGTPLPGTARPPGRFCASIFPRPRPTQQRPGRAPFARRPCRADSDA